MLTSYNTLILEFLLTLFVFSCDRISHCGYDVFFIVHQTNNSDTYAFEFPLSNKYLIHRLLFCNVHNLTCLRNSFQLDDCCITQKCIVIILVCMRTSMKYGESLGSIVIFEKPACDKMHVVIVNVTKIETSFSVFYLVDFRLISLVFSGTIPVSRCFLSFGRNRLFQTNRRES